MPAAPPRSSINLKQTPEEVPILARERAIKVGRFEIINPFAWQLLVPGFAGLKRVLSQSVAVHLAST